MAIFETIKLDKGLYSTGNGFLNELEKVDPSENYKGTSLEGLDAFERQLKRFDIKLKGPNSSPVEKFFSTLDSSVLFPEYVARAVRHGLREASVVDDLIATKTNINSLDYRTIYADQDNTDLELKHVGEGAMIPQTIIQTQDQLVALHKRGRMIVASYEAIRFQKLDLFSVMLRQIGAYIAQCQSSDAIYLLTYGDDNRNGINIVQPDSETGVAYNDLVKLWSGLSPYNLNTIITAPEIMTKILLLPEFRDASAGLNFHGTGSMITPFGAKLLKSKNIAANSLIGLDKSCALEMVTAGDIQTDFDRLIDRQLERTTITQIFGFAKIYRDAAKAMYFD